ncbi:hypothetical protein KAW18_13895 [candidate division WOR-3 bacterium]|nr:hypothetical protein [candidate division WOR-3 bacterium]
MAIEYRALATEMMATLRLRPCKCYRNGRCRADCGWVSGDCSRTVKKTEAEAFLETKGVDSSYDQDEVLETMKKLGFIKIYQCNKGALFFKDYFTEDGAPIVAFPL